MLIAIGSVFAPDSAAALTGATGIFIDVSPPPSACAARTFAIDEFAHARELNCYAES